MQVWLSYTGSFSDRVFGVASIDNDQVTWTAPQGCSARFRFPDYNYDNPGWNRFTLYLSQSTEPGGPGPLLFFAQETHWNAPLCQ